MLSLYGFVSGFIHSESDVRYFGEDVPGVSQVNKLLAVSMFVKFLSVFRVSQKIKPSVIKTRRGSSQCWAVPLSSTLPTSTLKNGQSVVSGGVLSDLTLFQADRSARPT